MKRRVVLSRESRVVSRVAPAVEVQLAADLSGVGIPALGSRVGMKVVAS